MADHEKAGEKRPSRQIAARTVAWLLAAVAAYDGAGFLSGGDSVASTNSYAALRLVPFGMRTWGVLLLIGAVAVAWGIGRDSAGRERALNITLAGGVAYYTLWTLVIPATWVWLHEVPSWGAPSKSALLAALYFACARATAPPRRGEGLDHGRE